MEGHYPHQHKSRQGEIHEQESSEFLLKRPTFGKRPIGDHRFCIILGNDEDTANTLADVLNLHPATLVLQGAEERIIGIHALDVFADYSPEKYRQTVEFIAKESVHGAIHPLVSKCAREFGQIYRKRFSNLPSLREEKQVITWNAPLALTTHLTNHPGELQKLLNSGEHDISFLWVNNKEDNSDSALLRHLQQPGPGRVLQFEDGKMDTGLMEKLSGHLGLAVSSAWLDTLPRF